MISVLSVNVSGVVVGIVVALVVVGGFGAYFYRKIKAKKSGKGCCCSGDCSSCSCCSFSFKSKKENGSNIKD